MARRFVAGETLDEAIAAARECNNAGMFASLDYLGENVATTSDAQHSAMPTSRFFERIAQEGLHANVPASSRNSASTSTLNFAKDWFAPSWSVPRASIIFCASTWRVCLHAAHHRTRQTRSRTQSRRRHGHPILSLPQ